MLEKNYTPKDFEEKIYADWENSGDFQPDMRSSSEAFSIVIPPPNVTGVLHLGHALDDTLQDILVRYNRMQGKKFSGSRELTTPVSQPRWWLSAIWPKKVFPAMIWDVKNLLKPFGNGKNSPAAQFANSCAVWVRLAIGRVNVLPWMKV